MRVILASKSPRRIGLLSDILADFEICPSGADENGEFGSPYEYVKETAKAKAMAVFTIKRQMGEKGFAVIGSDTVVVLDGEILGKPKDAADAERMLARLSGRTHTVLTGVCVLCDGESEKLAVNTSLVTFRNLSREEISDYVRIYRPLDKAGAYGVQDEYHIVDGFSGEIDNVMGFPRHTVRRFLSECGAI